MMRIILAAFLSLTSLGFSEDPILFRTEGTASDQSPTQPNKRIVTVYCPNTLNFPIESLKGQQLYLGSRGVLEKPNYFPVRDVEVSQTEEGEWSIAWTADRPVEGWRAVPFWPGLFVKKSDGDFEPIDRLDAVGQWFPQPWALSYADAYYQSPYQIEPLEELTEPIVGTEASVDYFVKLYWPGIMIHTSSSFADDFGDVQLYTLAGDAGGERLEGKFVGVEKESASARWTLLRYRFERPAIGWPATSMPLRLNTMQENLTLLEGSLRVAEGRQSVRLIVPEGQSVSSEEEVYEVQVRYEPTGAAMDLETIGDGDLRLRGTTLQDGRLQSTEVSEGGIVSAIYVFDRDPMGISEEGALRLEFASDVVRDLDGNPNYGAAEVSLPQLESVVEVIDARLVPIQSLSDESDYYRFRVLYASRGGALRRTDFDKAHLSLEEDLREPFRTLLKRYPEYYEVEDLLPTVESILTLSPNAFEVTYVVSKPGFGWQVGYRVRLLPGGLRDTDGGGFAQKDVGSVWKAGSRVYQPSILAGGTIKGDPLSHRVLIRLDINPLWASEQYTGDWRQLSLDGATARLGSFNAFAPEFSAVSRPAPIMDPNPANDGSTFSETERLVEIKINRPETGWNTWDQETLPLILVPSERESFYSFSEVFLPGDVIAGVTLKLEDRAAIIAEPQEAWPLSMTLSPRSSGGVLQINWQTLDPRPHRLQHSHDLKGWVDLHSSMIQGSSGETHTYTTTNPSIMHSPAGYFRLQLLQD